MCDSGLPEFPRADDLTLWKGMEEAARLDLPVAVHAESQELVAGQSSRPVLAELEAIQRACLMAGEAKARLHIVHVSSGRGVVAAAEARARGVDVSIETCPHYLHFSEEDVERLGALAKCAPPLRSCAHREELREQLANGTVDIVASDHSPAPPEMKTGDFGRAWGGVAGVQSTLAVLLEQRLPLERVAQLLAATPARRFRIQHKGAIRPGNHGDLTLVDLSASFLLTRKDMASRHGLSPYVGETFRGAVRRTIAARRNDFCRRNASPRIPAGNWFVPRNNMQAFGFTRSARYPDHLLQTPDTFIRAPLPGMIGATAIVHAAPAIGAKFTQYTAEFEPGGTLAPTRDQRFVYVLEGEVEGMQAGDYVWLPPESNAMRADSKARAIVIEKPYAPLDDVKTPARFQGSESQIAPVALQGDADLEVRSLIPGDVAFDLAVNTLTFQPGATLPMVEVHVMEHGLLMLEGAGIYRLGNYWYPVAAGDFIWMAPYLPQWFGALGKVPAKYLLYKDWNR